MHLPKFNIYLKYVQPLQVVTEMKQSPRNFRMLQHNVVLQWHYLFLQPSNGGTIEISIYVDECRSTQSVIQSSAFKQEICENVNCLLSLKLSKV